MTSLDKMMILSKIVVLSVSLALSNLVTEHLFASRSLFVLQQSHGAAKRCTLCQDSDLNHLESQGKPTSDIRFGSSSKQVDRDLQIREHIRNLVETRFDIYSCKNELEMK